jgi:arginyl-tRNA synthetase
METILDTLQKAFISAVEHAYDDISNLDVIIDVTESKEASHGHYQCNAAMKLARFVNQAPLTVAQTIVDSLKQLYKTEKPFFSKVHVAKPGFINIYLDDDFICKQLLMLAKQGVFLDRMTLKAKDKELILLDYSSPNVAKAMHVGHLRSTVIGDCMANLFTFLGHEVLRVNHIGDWGTSFGILLALIKEKDIETKLDNYDIFDLTDFYQEGRAKFEENKIFKKMSHDCLVKLQYGDKACLSIWQKLVSISLKNFQAIYALLDVKLVTKGESSYARDLPQIIDDFSDKKLVTSSDGAVCVFLDGFVNRVGEALPLIIQKSDKGYNYTTTDLAAIKYRLQVLHCKRVIYVTDLGQSLHFSMLFKAAEKVGYHFPEKEKVQHLGFGLVLNKDGKKMKTRSGQSIPLIQLIEQAIAKAQSIISLRKPDVSREEKKHLADALGVNAIKYADLSTNRVKDYVYDPDKMLAFEGNTAGFLMYAYVRMLSIMRQADFSFDQADPQGLLETSFTVVDQHETSLLLQILQFPEILKRSSDRLMPHMLTDYLYQLAAAFNVFFRDCRVVGHENEKSRLVICFITSRVILNGMKILGFTIVNKM